MRMTSFYSLQSHGPCDRVRDDFGADFNAVFNANKSKCLIIPPRYVRSKQLFCSESPVFTVGGGGNIIEFADHWPHLRHIILCNNFDDVNDIKSVKLWVKTLF